MPTPRRAACCLTGVLSLAARAPAGAAAAELSTDGVEWYLHEYRNFVDDQDELVSAPQAMMQWTIY